MLDPGLQDARLPDVRADNEHGIVTRDGADDFRPALLIDAGGHRLRASGNGQQDQQVAGGANLLAEAGEQLGDARQVCFLAPGARAR